MFVREFTALVVSVAVCAAAYPASAQDGDASAPVIADAAIDGSRSLSCDDARCADVRTCSVQDPDVWDSLYCRSAHTFLRCDEIVDQLRQRATTESWHRGFTDRVIEGAVSFYRDHGMDRSCPSDVAARVTAQRQAQRELQTCGVCAGGECQIGQGAEFETQLCRWVAERRPCTEAVTALHDIARDQHIALRDADQTALKIYYEDHAEHELRCPPPVSSGLQRGWLATALLRSDPSWKWGGHQQWGLQVLPSFSIGIPIAVLSSENDATRAMRGVTAVGGLAARVSPIGFWASLDLFFGTATLTNSSILPEAQYPSPSLMLFGIGVDALGGMIGVSWMNVLLHHDGFFSDVGASTSFIQVQIDLTAVGTTVAGLANTR